MTSTPAEPTNEVDAELVVEILRQELEKARWENILLRAKVTQMQRSTPSAPVG